MISISDEVTGLLVEKMVAEKESMLSRAIEKLEGKVNLPALKDRLKCVISYGVESYYLDGKMILEVGPTEFGQKQEKNSYYLTANTPYKDLSSCWEQKTDET